MIRTIRRSSCLILCTIVASGIVGAEPGSAQPPSSPPEVMVVELVGLPGGSYSEAHAINNAGAIVGGSRAADGHFYPVRWDGPDRIVRLDVPTEWLGGSASAINDHGVVIGRIGSPYGRAYCRQPM